MAFAIPAESLASWKSTLIRQGIAIESEVHADRGGYSLYFRDPDEHLIELVTPGLWQIY